MFLKVIDQPTKAGAIPIPTTKTICAFPPLSNLSLSFALLNSPNRTFHLWSLLLRKMRMMHSFTLIYVVNKQTISQQKQIFGNFASTHLSTSLAFKKLYYGPAHLWIGTVVFGLWRLIGNYDAIYSRICLCPFARYDFYNSHTKPKCREQCTNCPYPNFPISRVNGIKCKMQNDSFKRSEQPSNGNSLRWSSLISLTFEKFLF